MEFTELIKDVKNIRFETLRKDSEDSFEAVVKKDELTRLSEKLEKFFGVAIWPSKNKVPSSVQKVINDAGGIRSNQTLYFWSTEKDTIFAMLWPWQDGEHVTIKIVHLQQES